MKRYVGQRTGNALDVKVDGKPLNPRLDLWNHSPTGFEWGYAGSGPAQLALALLADVLDSAETAIEWHQDYKSAVVAALPYHGWTLTEDEIRGAIASLRIRRDRIQANRTLKVEEDGDFFQGRIKPLIRLKGYWLEQAGFEPGSHVKVRFRSLGVIELHSTSPTPSRLSETSRPPKDSP